LSLPGMRVHLPSTKFIKEIVTTSQGMHIMMQNSFYHSRCLTYLVGLVKDIQFNKKMKQTFY